METGVASFMIRSPREMRTTRGRNVTFVCNLAKTSLILAKKYGILSNNFGYNFLLDIPFIRVKQLQTTHLVLLTRFQDDYRHASFKENLTNKKNLRKVFFKKTANYHDHMRNPCKNKCEEMVKHKDAYN